MSAMQLDEAVDFAKRLSALEDAILNFERKASGGLTSGSALSEMYGNIMRGKQDLVARYIRALTGFGELVVDPSERPTDP